MAQSQIEHSNVVDKLTNGVDVNFDKYNAIIVVWKEMNVQQATFTSIVTQSGIQLTGICANTNSVYKCMCACAISNNTLSLGQLVYHNGTGRSVGQVPTIIAIYGIR